MKSSYFVLKEDDPDTRQTFIHPTLFGLPSEAYAYMANLHRDMFKPTVERIVPIGFKVLLTHFRIDMDMGDRKADADGNIFYNLESLLDGSLKLVDHARVTLIHTKGCFRDSTEHEAKRLIRLFEKGGSGGYDDITPSDLHYMMDMHNVILNKYSLQEVRLSEPSSILKKRPRKLDFSEKPDEERKCPYSPTTPPTPVVDYTKDV